MLLDPMVNEAPFGIYVHWPFCEKKCPYCDFNSHFREEFSTLSYQKRYLSAFLQELKYFRARTGPRLVTSIFFGGGTPSLMDPEICAAILEAIFLHYVPDDTIEISFEANPSSVEVSRFRAYRNAGVNRLSLGVQALCDESLKKLGRVHDKKQALEVIALSQEIFPRASFDLIYGRPEQSLSDWEKELSYALQLGGKHFSLYQLTIEKGTAFYSLYKKGALSLPVGDEAVSFYQLTTDIAKGFGLRSYEISNYAITGEECRHNMLYWRYQDYIGLGPGAHSRFFEKEKLPYRSAVVTHYQPEKWLCSLETQGQAVKENEYLSEPIQADEMLLMHLRLDDYFDLSYYSNLRGRAISVNKIIDLENYGLLKRKGDYKIKPTQKGRLLLDQLILTLAS